MIVFLHKCPEQEDPAVAITGTQLQHLMSLALGKCSGKHLLLENHSILVLALRNGGRVTKFSIKRKVIKITFHKGIPRPHSGAEHQANQLEEDVSLRQ